MKDLVKGLKKKKARKKPQQRWVKYYLLFTFSFMESGG